MNSTPGGRNDRRLSLPFVTRQPQSVSRSHPTEFIYHQRRRATVHIPQPNTLYLHSSTDDDDDDDKVDAITAEAQAMAEIHTFHRQLSQLLTEVSQLQVRTVTAVYIIRLAYSILQ